MYRPSQLRKVAHASGAVIAFLPDPPRQMFRQPNSEGALTVTALSFSGDDGRSWVRGWEFSLRASHEVADKHYVDAPELEDIATLAAKSAAASSPMGYVFRSTEGVIFKMQQASQSISMSTGFTSGVEGPTVVEDVLAFMSSSAKLWE